MIKKNKIYMNMKIEVQQNMNTKKTMNTDEDFWLVIQKYMMYMMYIMKWRPKT